MNAFIALLSWNPEIRNILSLGVGIAVLVGSVILLVSTNTGPRTGMLIGLASLLGWLTIMGLVWWMYGIGMKGTPSHWRVVDVNVGALHQSTNEKAAALPTVDEVKTVADIRAKHPELEDKVNPEHKADKVPTIGELVEADPALVDEFKLTPDDLGGWHLLVPSNPSAATRRQSPMPSSVPTARRSSRTARATRSSRPTTSAARRTTTRSRARHLSRRQSLHERRAESVQRRVLASRPELVRHVVPHPSRTLRHRAGAGRDPAGDLAGSSAANAEGRHVGSRGQRRDDPQSR